MPPTELSELKEPLERIAKILAGLLLKDIGRDANARAVAGGHAEGEIDALDVELVEVFRANVGTVLVVAVDDAGEIDRWNRDLSLRREHRRRREREPGGECS